MRDRQIIIACLLCLFLSPGMRGSAAEEAFPIQAGKWKQAAPAPTARTEVSAAVLDRKIYVIGGFAPLRFGNLLKLSVTDQVAVYDPDRDRWQTAASLPLALHHTAAVSIGGRLFVVGGFKPSLTSVWNPVNTVFEYLSSENRWVQRSPMPTARGALAAAGLDGKIFAMGGFDGDRSLAVVEYYDPDSDTWQSTASLSVPRDHLAATSIDGKLYAMGGRVNLDYHRNLGVTEVYDHASGRWHEVAPLPTPRSGIAAGVIKGMLLVVGGEGGEGTFGNNEVYWPKTNTWRPLSPLPTPRHGLAAAVVDNRLYTLCGGTQPGGSYSKVNEVFTLKEWPPR